MYVIVTVLCMLLPCYLYCYHRVMYVILLPCYVYQYRALCIILLPIPDPTVTAPLASGRRAVEPRSTYRAGVSHGSKVWCIICGNKPFTIAL